MSTLQGRIAVITGAGRGLGRSHALLFAELGAKVVVNDNGAAPDGSGQLSQTSADEVVALITERGGEAVAHLGSVSDWNSAHAMIDLAISTFGGLDILVNNAGILRDRMLVNMTESEWDAVIDVHLKGHFVPLHHAAVYWRDQAKLGAPRKAAVINTSSGSGLRGNPGQINYASAKAGIAGMTQVAARELERYGVRVNAIAPVARTRLTMATPGLRDRIGPGDGFDTWAPENVSPLVAWLAQEDCQVSGQLFTIMGGHLGWERGWSRRESFDKDDRWTPEDLAKALAELPPGTEPFTMSA
jgi:NAD(P)-dependent dehydrogenase (short-subunit alcohol dehydrogenase family)